MNRFMRSPPAAFDKGPAGVSSAGSSTSIAHSLVRPTAMSTRSSIVAFALVALAAPAYAQQTGSFVVRLGTDTTSVERYTRTARRIEVEQVGRVPRVLHRRFTYDLAPSGATTRASATVTVPGAPAGAPFQQIDANVE